MLLDVFVGLHLSLLLIISIRVLTRYDLTAQARLAWIVVLFLLPYVGLLVYWMFGEIHLGHCFTERYRSIIRQLHQHHPEVLGHRDTLLSAIPLARRPAFAHAAAVTAFHTTEGNRAELMQNARDTHIRMINDFDAATDHIHVLYYIWLEDDTGHDVAYALIRAVKRGVTCRAMVDGLGSRKLVKSRLWQLMANSGVQVSVALSIKNILKVLLVSRIDLRNHRKITIIDGKIGYVGSRNCADPEFRVKPKYAPWVDIMLRMEGPVVAQNQILFASDWIMENPDTPIEHFSYSTVPKAGGFAAQVFEDGPTERSNATPQFLNALIVGAQKRLIISTPYFVPNYTLINTLCATAYRGVEVIMIFPQQNDSFIVAATSHSYYWQLLAAGVRIYEYKVGLLHAKTLTVDDEVCLIGSTNLDLRSFDLNYENNVLWYDQALTGDIIERQREYINDADEVFLAQVENWSLPYRALNNVIAMVGPIL